MMVLREMRRRARFLVTPVLGIAVASYFAYHMVEGDRGLRAWFHLTQDLRTARANLAAVQAERAALDRKVANMRPDHVDPDLLDEQIRTKLDLGGTGEIVIMQPPDRR
jgi:cell division protein FtsB